MLSFIEEDVILTAAHCVYGKRFVFNVAQGAGELQKKKQLYKIKAIKIHENYEPKLIHHDIALLFLEKGNPIGA